MRRHLSALLAAALAVTLLPAYVTADTELLDLVGAREGTTEADAPLTFAPRGQSEDRFPEATTPTHDYLTAHDGTQLHARVFRPDTSSDPDWLTPVILVHSPYYPGALLGSAGRSLDIVEYFTPKGYTVVLSDVRGTGNSAGCLEQDSPNQARDFKTFVEHYAAQPWSNGTVGSYGKSYDAETQNAGAILRPEGLTTMVTVAGISSLYDVYAFDGVPVGTDGLGGFAAYLLVGSDLPSEPAELAHWAERFDCQVENGAEGVAPDGDRDLYWAERDFRPGVRDIEASVLHVHGLNDGIVTPIAIDGWFDELPTFKRAIWGQWAHFYPYDAPNQLARDDWYDTIHAWFDHELLGLDTGIEQWPPVQVQDESNVWRGVPSFSQMGTERVFGATADGALTSGEGTGPAGSVVAGPAGASQAAYLTEPFADGLHVSGRALVELTAAVDRPVADLEVRLEEVRADGSSRQLNIGWLSLDHAESLLRQVPPQVGHPVPYRIRTYPKDRTLAPGSRLRLVIRDVSHVNTPKDGFTAELSDVTLRLPVVEEECGLLVAQRQEPQRPLPDCDGGIPSATPLTDVGAARGHEATSRVVGTSTEKVGGVDAVREWGYLTVRDGVELAYELVRPAGDGPYPVLLTYDGYFAGGDPDSGYASRYLPNGYALAGLQVRGTGCSGGVFDFFQPAEGVDGYEMVEWLASREWAAGRVAMVGKSYPGITQLFTANTAPPSLVAIAPGHYFADVYRDVAFPGGIFNYAFAALWSFASRPAQDYAGAADDVFGGDQTCAEHQAHNATSARYNPFVQAQEHTTDDPLIRDRSPLYGAHRIEVPVFQALSWQDEQLSSRNVRFLEDLERLGVDYRAVLSNGDHGTYREPEQLRELDRFFEAHLEQRAVLRDGTTLEDYLAEPPITVLWEQDETSSRWATTLQAWSGAATPWRLETDRELQPVTGLGPVDKTSPYLHSPAGQQGIANAEWGGGPDVGWWDKYSPPPGSAAAFQTFPFEEDTTLLGSASADLWITATAPNVDVQVTLTEVRPDGTEVYVQQGWLRTSQRELDASRSTELAPYQTHSRYDQQPLSATEPSLARVEIFPFGHVFREGSQLRLWIEAPTAMPQLWGFAGDPTPAVVTVHWTAEHRSSLVLPLVDAPIPAEFRGQEGQFACGTAVRLECRPDPLA